MQLQRGERHPRLRQPLAAAGHAAGRLALQASALQLRPCMSTHGSLARLNMPLLLPPMDALLQGLCRERLLCH